MTIETKHPPEGPYKGLDPYSEEDAPFFFGRESEREIITANLMASRLTLFYGESGVGKSSVLRAGVAYHLGELAKRNLAERGTPEFALVYFNSWRDDPLTGLVKEVQDSVGKALNIQFVEPPSDSRRLDQILQALAERAGGDLFIILDQFEEYFLYHGQEEGEGSFALEFPRAVNRADLRASFLISIREDSLAKLDRFKGRIPNLFDNYLRINHLNPEAARDAIQEPIGKWNEKQNLKGTEKEYRIEPPLVDAVLDQVRAGRVVLGEAGKGRVGKEPAVPTDGARIETPYLQLVMTRLWKEENRAGSHTLRLDTLNKRLGGAENIVKTHLDEVMKGLSQREQKAAAIAFFHLVTPSGTKIAHGVSDLADFTKLKQDQLKPTLEKLCQADTRVLRPVGPSLDRPEEQRYEVFHDVLCKSVSDWRARYVGAQKTRRLAGWIGLLLVLFVAALGTAGYTFRLKQEADRLKQIASHYVLEARSERDKAKEASDRAEKAAAIAEEQKKQALLAKDKAVSAQENAETEKQRADQQARVAFARELAAAAMRNLTIDPEVSVLLGLHAASDLRSAAMSVVPQVEDALHQSVQASRIQLTLTGHAAPVLGLAFSPDGQRIATASYDKTAKVWDAASGKELLTLSGHTDGVAGLAFSPDGQRIATASWDRTAKIWDAASGKELLTLSGHTDWVNGLAFSPDGKRIATASWDRTAKVWDAASGDELYTLSDRVAGARCCAFSRDGKRLAVGMDDGRVEVYAADIDGLIKLARTRVTRDLTPAERKKYLHEK